MRISITYGVLLALSLTAAAFPSPFTPRKRTVADVQADIATITSQVSALNASINSFPNILGTFTTALSIHVSASNIEASTNKATADVKSTGPLGESDANAIFQSIQVLQPIIIAAVEGVIAKKPAFDRVQLPVVLPAGETQTAIRGNLCNLRAATTNFGNALIANAPDDLKDDGTAILATLDAEFAKALLAYAA